MFKFRVLTPEDYPLLLDWLSKEHIKQWWNDGDDTLEKVAQHYGESNDVRKFILLENKDGKENPIGYFQYYVASERSIGIDQFIGEEDYLNRGIGTQAIELFVEMIKLQHQPDIIILDPSPENNRAIRCYEKVGFKHYKTRKVENGQTAYMMRLDCK